MDSDSEESLINSSEDELCLSESESESEDDSLDSIRIWTPVDITANITAPPRFPFIGNSGIQISIPTEDPLEYFDQFFNEEVISFIVEETNRYAEKFLDSNELTPSSRILNWKDTTSKEMKCFFALLLLQGVIDKPKQKWFWSARPIISTPFFGKVMSEKRFSLIMKFLHFENSENFNAETHPNPKLRKIYDLHSMLIQRFKTVYIPNENISIDESLIAHKGFLGWKQYIPSKRARFGIKMFQLCEADSGYIWNSVIYTGKGTIFMPEYESYGLSTKTVMSLIHDLKNRGYLLTTDNFYTSPELAELLLQCKTDICGTVRPNRKGLPPKIKSENLKRGDMIAFQKGKMCAMKWKDKKNVLMLSTIHTADMVEVITKEKKVLKKPTSVINYNKTMGGVDKSDQCLSYYPVARNHQQKYYKKVFRHLLNQSVWNSFVLYKKNGGLKSHLDFRMKLIERLIEEGDSVHEQNVRKYSVKHVENVARLTGRHFPSHVENTEKRKAKARQCVVCSQKKNENGKRIRRETRFQCDDCNVGLCAAPCFKIYHTHLDF